MKWIIGVFLVAAALTGYALAQEPDSSNEAPPQKVEQQEKVVKFDGGISVYFDKDPRVEVAAEILGGQSRLLEFLVVGSGGPVHEALFVIGARAYDLHQGLEILGLKAGEKKLSYRGDETTPDGPGVSIDVIYTDQEGNEQTIPVEDWVLDNFDDQPMKRGPWTFTGSISTYQEDLERDTYLADQLSVAVALWRDPSCVINNPREHGAIADVYLPNHGLGEIPAPGSPVTLTFRPWQAEDEK